MTGHFCSTIRLISRFFSGRPELSVLFLFRYTHLTQPLEDNFLDWNESLDKFSENGTVDPSTLATRISHIASLSTTTLADQLRLLGSIPNYHWLGEKGDVNVSFIQHLSFHPDMKDKPGGGVVPCYLPGSPRNQLMFFLANAPTYSDRVKETLRKLVAFDKRLASNQPQPTCDTSPPPRKRRKYTAKTVRVEPENMVSHFGVSLQNFSDFEIRPLYSDFVQDMISDGVIQWRKHSDEEDVVVMSDYSPTTGRLLPLGFVTVQAVQGMGGGLFVKCSCPIYKQLQIAGLESVDLGEDDVPFLDFHTITCMHCRFFSEHLEGCFEKLQQGTDRTRLLSMIEEGLPKMDEKIVLLGTPSYTTTTKFSVAGDEDFSLVHVSFVRMTGCYVQCQNGLCRAQLKNRKKFPKVVKISEKKENLCSHVVAMNDNFGMLSDLFPLYFDSSEAEIEPVPDVPRLDQENDMTIRDTADRVWFNTTSGLWESKMFSTHTPREMEDPVLVDKTEWRNSFVRKDNKNNNGGYIGPDLIPPVKDANGRYKPCACGHGFAGDREPDGVEPTLSSTTYVYTRNVSLYFFLCVMLMIEKPCMTACHISQLML